MNFLQRIDDDLKNALKAKETVKVSVLRLLKASMSNQAIQKGKASLEEGEIVEVIRSQIKQRDESVAAFSKGNRPDLVQKETQELAILKTYLPQEMSEAELRTLIQEIIQSLGVSGAASMGTVMKAVMPKVAGRADGKLINQLVKELLG